MRFELCARPPTPPRAPSQVRLPAAPTMREASAGSQREIVVTMHFGRTQLEVRAHVLEGGKPREVEASFRFASTS